MAKIDTRGLDRFRQRVSLINLSEKKLENIAEAVAERGIQIASRYYGGRSDVTISSTKEGGGHRKLIATGAGLSFEEFGTGLTGKGTYQGKLPTEIIRFPSKFTKTGWDETKGWVYNYRRKKRGTDYWWYNGWLTYGEPAQAQMFKTAQDLRQEIADIVIKEIKRSKK